VGSSLNGRLLWRNGRSVRPANAKRVGCEENLNAAASHFEELVVLWGGNTWQGIKRPTWIVIPMADIEAGNRARQICAASAFIASNIGRDRDWTFSPHVKAMAAGM